MVIEICIYILVKISRREDRQEDKAKGGERGGGGREGKSRIKGLSQGVNCGFLLWLKKIMNIFHFIPFACLYFLFFSNKYKLLL